MNYFAHLQNQSISLSVTVSAKILIGFPTLVHEKGFIKTLVIGFNNIFLLATLQ